MLKLAVAGLALQALVYLAGGVSLYLDARSKSEHGQEGAGSLVGAGTLVVLLALLLAASGAMALRRVSWTRLLTVAVEGLLFLGGLIGVVGALIAQDPLGIAVTMVMLVLAAGIAGLLLCRPAHRWFAG